MSKPQRKGPLRKIVETVTFGDSVFGCNTVILECGHKARSNGMFNARCAKCAMSAARLEPRHDD